MPKANESPSLVRLPMEWRRIVSSDWLVVSTRHHPRLGGHLR